MILFSGAPGRVTRLGEVEGNRMRRIYTDGRGHPEEPDLTLHRYSIGQREGDVLVVDTTAIAPQAYIAPSEAVRHSKRWRHSHRRAALFGQAE